MTAGLALDEHALRIRIDEKTYDGRDPILRGVALDIGRGTFVSIMGRTGSGKSTLLRIIAGLDRSFRGEIRSVGTAVQAQLCCGMAFQDSRLLPWLTVAGNVAFGLSERLSRHEREQAVFEMLALVELPDAARTLPHQLSGGMQRRVALARALIGNPDILLLDEPFSALDVATKRRMHDLIQKVGASRSLTTIMVTHDIEEAVFLSDRIIILSAQGTTDIELARCGIRRRTDPDFLVDLGRVIKLVDDELA